MKRSLMATFAALLLGTSAIAGCSTSNYSRQELQALSSESKAALDKLVKENPAAEAISKKASSVLIFPSIVKAGLGIGGAYGDGELQRNGVTLGRYRSVSASWGLQAGAQTYGYALFLMNKKAEGFLETSGGWEIGLEPTVVVVDQGVAASLSTTTLSDNAYAFIFDQQGLMAGISIEGTKVTKLNQ